MPFSGLFISCATPLANTPNVRLRKMNQSIIKKAIRNKILNEGTIGGYTVEAINGTKLFDNPILFVITAY